MAIVDELQPTRNGGCRATAVCTKPVWGKCEIVVENASRKPGHIGVGDPSHKAEHRLVMRDGYNLGCYSLVWAWVMIQSADRGSGPPTPQLE
jgi:hypothetical protein